MAQSTVMLFSYGLIRLLLNTLGYNDHLYLDQTPPGSTPVIFAPGIVSLPDRREEVITFSADGSEIYYSIEYYPDPTPSFTLFTRYENGRWTKPDTASFSKGRRTSEPFLAFGGNRIYYFANNVKNQKRVLDLCYSSRENDTWSEPISLPSPPNFETPNYTLHPCVISDTSIYFSSFTGEVCKSTYIDGKYRSTEILPRPINFENVTGSECWGDPYVSPSALTI